MELQIQIDSNGLITSLWNDVIFADMEGNKSIERASEVEFDGTAQGWIVTILRGLYSGCCLPEVFTHRAKAIDAEIVFFNQEMNEHGMI